MKYKTIDELGHFRFEKAIVCELTQMNGYFHGIFDAVTILPENTTNRDLFEMGANNLHFTIEDGKISSFIKEGYRRYDANEVLVEEIPDEDVAPEDYNDILKSLREEEVISFVQEGDDYILSVDTMYHVYCIHITGVHDKEEWDRYINIREN